jgi:hypothetical protein
MVSSYIFVRVTAVVRVAVPILRTVYLWGCIKYFKENGNSFVVYMNGAYLATQNIYCRDVISIRKL